MSSLDTTTEDGDTFVSNTDAIIYPISDYSGWGGDSMISDPNIVLSSTSTDDHYQQQISTGGGGGDLMSESSSVASSSWFKNNNNNNNNNKQSEIRIFNVDFQALSEQVAVPSPSSFKALIQPAASFLSEQVAVPFSVDAVQVFSVEAGCCATITPLQSLTPPQLEAVEAVIHTLDPNWHYYN